MDGEQGSSMENAVIERTRREASRHYRLDADPELKLQKPAAGAVEVSRHAREAFRLRGVWK
jgi:hypothetical protein